MTKNEEATRPEERAQFDEALSSLHGAPMYVAISRTDGTPEYYSDHFLNYIGMSFAEASVNGWAHLLHPEDIERDSARWTRAVASGTPYQSEFRLRGRDGSYRWLLGQMMPLRDERGEIERWVALSIDIHERKELERREKELKEALEERQALYRALAEALPAHVVIVDDAGSLDYCNHAYRAYTGLSAGEASEWQRRQVIHPDDSAKAMETWDRALQERMPFSNEIRVRRHDGEYRWFSLEGVPLKTAGRSRWLTIAVDIDDRRREEVERERWIQELEKANAAKDEFLGLVSHELRTPLTVIRGYAQVLVARSHELDEGARNEALQDVLTESERLQRIVENLLTLARLEQGAVAQHEPTRVIDVVRESIARHHRSNPDREFIIQERERPRPVPLARTHVEQVIENLITNAEKYSPVSEPITIKITRTSAEVQVRVLDRGVGIGEADSERLFDPFYRGNVPPGAAGIGVGLSVCLRLVESQGGRMWAENREGGGSEFGFALPVADHVPDA